MIFTRPSRQQTRAALWWYLPETRDYEAVICDGAIRSGKTLWMTLGFVLWSMTAFRDRSFALCGRSIESLRRNLTNLLPRWLAGVCTVTEHRGENRLTISRGAVHNTYYLFGGHDEQSYTYIQGVTLAGVLLDEVALMPRSFVEQAVARCSEPGSRLFFSCNPESPGHWFYQNWILQAEKRRALHLHFTLEDNPALDPAVAARYRRLYTGAFYRRYVLGQWCAAQGLVYPLERQAVVSEELPGEGVRWYISVDYGTRNPCSMGLWAVNPATGQALRWQESYYDSRKTGRQKTDEEYYVDLCNLAGLREIDGVVVDPSALSFLTVIRQHGRFPVRKADNDVLTGVRVTGEYLRSGRLKLHPRCVDALRELENYRWEASDTRDTPRKEQDHAMDDMRYFVMTVLRRM